MAEGPRGDKVTAVPGGMERLLKARGVPAPPCMALEHLFEKTWREM